MSELRDKEFLKWIYDRLIKIHKEYELVDFMIRFKSIIDSEKSP